MENGQGILGTGKGNVKAQGGKKCGGLGCVGGCGMCRGLWDVGTPGCKGLAHKAKPSSWV